MYEVVVLKSAEKALLKLPTNVQLKISEAIDELVQNPRPSGTKKLTGRSGYRIRVGDYRVIYEIEDDKLIVYVVEVGGRKDIYKRK